MLQRLPRPVRLLFASVLLPLFAVLLLMGLLKLSALLPGPTDGASDLRTNPALPGAWVAFCARGESISGHAFVLIGDGNDNPQWDEAYGLYPAEGIGLFGAVPCALITEDPQSSIAKLTHQMRIRVDVSVADRVRAVLRDAERSGRFQVAGNDCVTVMGRIANDLGLDTPARWSHPMPQAWLRGLIAMNDDLQ